MLSTKSELFVAIAEEEQEVVAGGFGFGILPFFGSSITAGESSYYKASNLTATGGVASGPTGSTDVGGLSLTKIATGVSQGFNVNGISI